MNRFMNMTQRTQCYQMRKLFSRMFEMYLPSLEQIGCLFPSDTSEWVEGSGESSGRLFFKVMFYADRLPPLGNARVVRGRIGEKLRHEQGPTEAHGLLDLHSKVMLNFCFASVTIRPALTPFRVIDENVSKKW